MNGVQQLLPPKVKLNLNSTKPSHYSCGNVLWIPEPSQLFVKLISSSNLLLSSFFSDDFTSQTPLDVGNGLKAISFCLIFMYPFTYLFSKYTECVPCRDNMPGSGETVTEESDPYFHSSYSPPEIDRIPVQHTTITTFYTHFS